MTDTISYPTDDMSATSKSLVSFIDEQWQQHTALFMNNADSYSALLKSIADVIPGAGGKAADLSTVLETYHKQYQQCYQALHNLAVSIDTAAQAMSNEDQQRGSGFQP
ncbi:MAG TPA: hypothetical protein VFV38_45415 [Ktedonobacteraceae bacterium]|nr:hypothetical protein [Ktedonobacteraceae bacterium]